MNGKFEIWVTLEILVLLLSETGASDSLKKQLKIKFEWEFESNIDIEINCNQKRTINQKIESILRLSDWMLLMWILILRAWETRASDSYKKQLKLNFFDRIQLKIDVEVNCNQKRTINQKIESILE